MRLPATVLAGLAGIAAALAQPPADHAGTGSLPADGMSVISSGSPGPDADGRPVAEGPSVDLEIVLAVDASASVDKHEWALQIDGIAAAFRDPAVQGAILSGPTGAIAAALVVWADATLPKQETPWAVLDSHDRIEAFAAMVELLPREVYGGTGIGDGVAVALDMLRYNGIEAPRQVVDVSGDGIETPPRDVLAILTPQARAIAQTRGVTVNGLAILTDVPDLDRWYRNNVIAGPSSFVMTAADFHDFRRAMREKLLREIEVRIGANGTGPLHRAGLERPSRPASLRR